MGLYSKAETLSSEGETVALVTVTAVEGSAPRDPGTSMLVRADGEIEGTIGGGTVEELSRRAAVEAIEEGEPRREQWELRPGGNTGMVCDGHMDVFINVLEGKRRLIVAGGGHIAVPVVRIADRLGYETIVIDDREEFADPERFPEADVIHADVRDGFDEVAITANTAVVIATRSGTLDRRSAERALPSDAFYVGCVASRTKADHIRSGLREDGLDEELISRLRAPVGLDLGADSPAEIALSILAEVQAVRGGGTGRPHTEVPSDEDVETGSAPPESGDATTHPDGSGDEDDGAVETIDDGGSEATSRG